MTTDEQYMGRCIELAEKGNGSVAPNPMVGCVIVRQGEIIGEGFHQKCGESHAEVNAIRSVVDAELLKDATLYVNLEPCSHWGKTPPCSELIIRMGIPRVVVGMVDPFEKVSGRGIAMLREAGIEVKVGVLEQESKFLNRKFITHNTQKRPYIILKWAQTSDGYLDNNRSKETPPMWITGASCKTLVHRMRANVDAIMVGTNSVERDNPSLTVRECTGKNPIRVVVDRTLRLTPDRNVFSDEAETVLITTDENIEKAENIYRNITIVSINFAGDIEMQILEVLQKRNIETLFIEGGADVLTRFISRGLWDEAHVFVSPLLVSDIKGGNDSLPLGVKAPVIRGGMLKNIMIESVKYSTYLNK